MKAALIEHRGQTAAIKDVPLPTPNEGEILVRVTAAGVNPVDWKVRDGDERRLPFVLGQDFAGVVVDTGSGARKYRVDERVFGIAREHGAYAEFTVVPEDDHTQPIAKIPDAVGDAEAAALPTAGLTALASLDALGVMADTKVLILGATGGVGGFAVQIARDRGACVIGTARASNEEFARSLGVDQFIAYDAEDVAAAVRRNHPDGIDAVLDLVDDREHLRATASVLREGGRIVSTIGAADAEGLAKRNVTAINLVMTQTPQSSHAGLRALANMVEQRRLRVPIVAEHGLVEAERALQESKSGTVDGKIVLTVG
ncbi:MAG: NADP-dependent oxidoreductase [Candidatus Eremiobacteraeota bacterium]|nr:NADP-dependent oxidoreductase [Candidatus Eremiobacteraeota bacterium]